LFAHVLAADGARKENVGSAGPEQRGDATYFAIQGFPFPSAIISSLVYSDPHVWHQTCVRSLDRVQHVRGKNVQDCAVRRLTGVSLGLEAPVAVVRSSHKHALGASVNRGHARILHGPQ